MLLETVLRLLPVFLSSQLFDQEVCAQLLLCSWRVSIRTNIAAVLSNYSIITAPLFEPSVPAFFAFARSLSLSLSPSLPPSLPALLYSVPFATLQPHRACPRPLTAPALDHSPRLEAPGGAVSAARAATGCLATEGATGCLATEGGPTEGGARLVHGRRCALEGGARDGRRFMGTPYP